MNRKSEGNQRKNFPSKDEIIHIHLKGMRNGARYLPISIGFGLCLADSFGNLTACPGENKVNDNTVSSPSSNFVSEMFRFVETFQIRMNEASHLISARQKSVGEVHYDVHEFWADGFYRYYDGERDALQRSCPQLYAYIENTVNSLC